MRRRFPALVLFWGTTLALAQEDAIRWRTNPQEAVNEAKQTLRPLMVYVLAASHDRDDKLEREQKRSLADPRVVRLSARVIPLRLSRSEHADILPSFGLSQAANMEMSFVAPDGQKLGDLSAGGVAQADALVKKLELVLKAQAENLYKTQVQPQLENADAKPEDLKRALKVIENCRITAADEGVAKLLEREKLDAGVRQLACDTLASLSTKTAVEKLLALSRAANEPARKALEKCTPLGAELLLAGLTADQDGFDYAAYKAATQICKVRSVKSPKFFENSSPRLKTEELDRVRKLVAAEAERWRKEYGDDR